MFETITSMIDLAFSIAPLMLILVVVGAVFKILSQFQTGEVFGFK